MPGKLSFTLFFIIIQFFLNSLSIAAESSKKIDELLLLGEAPTGVVFEIVSGDINRLKLALPKTQKYIKQLREKFPGLEIAIVTHGNEQFALKQSNNKKFKKVHSLTQQLVNEDHVPLHVCGTYASWKNISAEEFPDYVDVTAAGPATINDYVSLGYILVKLD